MKTEKLIHELATVLEKVWWFVENVNEETPDRTDRFFELRGEVRDVFAKIRRDPTPDFEGVTMEVKLKSMDHMTASDALAAADQATREGLCGLYPGALRVLARYYRQLQRDIKPIT